MVYPLSILSLSLLSLAALCRVSAQTIVTPSGWRDIESTLSRTQRQALAWEAASELTTESGQPPGDTPHSTVANMAITLSSQDLLTGNTSWKPDVDGNELSAWDTGLTFNVDLAYFGLAELCAYHAYNDSIRLNYSVTNWELIYTHSYVTTSQGNSSLRNITTDCESSLGGMVFYRPESSNDNTVNSYTIAAWIALSSRLAEVKHNTTYLDAAELSIMFMQTHMLNLSNPNGIISNTFNASTCVTSSDTPVTWDLGPFIEGLSIVANITQNQTYIDLLSEIVPKAVSFQPWHDETGILSEKLSDFRKGTMIRGLLEVWRRNPSNTALVKLIEDYITIQLNAIQKNALINDGRNNYRYSWLGDSPPQYTITGNVEALSVLNAASEIVPISDDSPDTQKSHTSVGTIVGAVVGSTAVLAAATVVAIIVLRRRRELRERPEGSFELSPRTKARPAVDPFVMRVPENTNPVVPSKGGPYLRIFDWSAQDAGNELAGTRRANEPATPLDHAQTHDSSTSGNDSSALYGIERRLDNLIDALAIRGEVEGAPPGYDARQAASNGPGHVHMI